MKLNWHLEKVDEEGVEHKWKTMLDFGTNRMGAVRHFKAFLEKEDPSRYRLAKYINDELREVAVMANMDPFTLVHTHLKLAPAGII